MEQISIFDGTQDFKIDKPIRLIELFGGIGSQAKALENLGANFEHYRLCEFDKYAVASYNAIHGTDFVTSDITKISAADLGIVDTDKYDYIMTYSFPCQDLSNAGKQKGMAKGSGTRSGLLWEVERLLQECKNGGGQLPQVLLMENVPQVHSKSNMNDFTGWIKFLENKGYKNYYKDLNAKNFGVPQNRNRCFMVSILGDYNYIFPQETELKLHLKDLLEEEVDEKFYLSDSMVKYISANENTDIKLQQVGTLVGDKWDKMHESSKRVYDENGLAPTLHTCGGGNLEPKVLIKNDNSFVGEKYKEFIDKKGYIPEMFNPYNCNEIDKIAPAQTTICGCTTSSSSVLIKKGTKHNSRNIEQVTNKTICLNPKVNGKQPSLNDRIYSDKGCSMAITTNPFFMGNVINNYRIRKLTPKECWRLMGFSDVDFDNAAAHNSNAQLYKQAGNSIVVNVLMAIFKQML